MLMEAIDSFFDGFSNYYGLLSSVVNVRFQEDISSLMSPTLYMEYLLPNLITLSDAFEYTLLHTHSGFLNICAWKELLQSSNLNCFEVALDPVGPPLEDTIETMKAMNERVPLIVVPCFGHQEKVLLEHRFQFPGSIAMIKGPSFDQHR